MVEIIILCDVAVNVYLSLELTWSTGSPKFPTSSKKYSFNADYKNVPRNVLVI